LRTLGFVPVEEAADLAELQRRESGAPRPDIVVVSLLPSVEALTALIREIRDWAPHARIVIIASALDGPALSAGFAAGAAGYLLENISRDGLEYSLRLVSAGENVFPSELASTLSTSGSVLSGSIGARDELRNLHATEREIYILRCVASGESNKLIAKKLDISEAEVRTHIKRIQRILGVSNRTQAALWGVARGLAAPFADATQDAAKGGTARERTRT